LRLSNFNLIAKTITFRRRSRRITQKQLALMVGVSPRTIFALENGDTSISVKTFFAVAAALGYRIDIHLETKSKNVEPGW
jgi:transcriptional regulator with XRE-family HTH domain